MSKFEKEQVFDFPSVLICGYGIVGKHLREEMPFAQTCDPDPDMGADFLTIPPVKYDMIFIAVPTPNRNGRCDTSFVEKVLRESNASLYVLKSTVPPSTTKSLSERFGRRIVFSPEYKGSTPFADAGDFLILGGAPEDCHKVSQMYGKIKPSSFRIHVCTSTEAEIIKYMENGFLAMKVIFCNQFKDIADLYGADYDRIREGFIMDERVGSSHTRVYDDARGYGSKCLSKDIPAFVNELKDKGFTDFILETVDRINNGYIKEKTYGRQEIP